MFSQRQIKDFIFETVEEARNSGRPNEVCYIVETKSWYKAVITDKEDDGKNVIDGGYPPDKNLKWVRLKSPFEPWRDPVLSYAYSDPGEISTLNPGDRYIVKPTGSHDWEGYDNYIAIWENEQWNFVEPQLGDIVLTLDTFTIYKFVEEGGNRYWKNILSDFASVIDTSYEDLVNDITNNNLIPGTYYRIVNYHTTNWVDSEHSEQYTSENEPIYVLALTSNIISSSALSQKHPHDTISYSIESKVKVYGEILQSKGFSGDWGTTQTNLKRYTWSDATDKVETTSGNFIDDNTLNLPNVDVTIARIKVGNESRWRKLDGSEGVQYDGNNITLTEEGLSFKYTEFGFEYRKAEFINLYVEDDEYPTGKIYYRKDTSTNVEADFDFRNFRIKKYKGQSTVGQDIDEDYYMYSSQDRLLWQDYDGNNQGYRSSEESALIEPILACVNTSVFNTRYSVIRNNINCKITNVFNSSIFSGNNNIIHNSAFLIFNANSKIENCKINSTKYLYTVGYAYNGLSVEQVKLQNVEIINVFSNLLVASQSIQNSKIVGSGYTYFTEDITISDSIVDLSGIKVAYNTRFNINNSEAAIKNVKIDNLSDINVNNSKVVINGNGNSYLQNHIFNSDVKFNVFQNSTISGIINNSNLNINVYNSTIKRIDNSEIKGTLKNFTFDRNIINSAINISDTHPYKLPSIPLLFLCDTSSNPIDLELPDEPYEGLRFAFVDSQANAETNNITINVSSSPAGGIINTINGDTSKSININYGFLELYYSSTAGWIVVDETIKKIDVDDITITIEDNKLTIKNINYIIDDDNQSIDGSDTPASDAHSELVTRAYVDNIASTISQAEDITYSDLVDKINNSQLQTNKYYRIVDYTHRNYQDSTESTIYEIVHPIIVKASNENTLYKEAIDPDYLEDVIIYDINNEGISTTGRIIYRHDRRRNIEGDFDWRLTRYERWQALFSNWEASDHDYPFLASSNNITGFGYDQDGNLKTLEAGDSAGLYPIIKDDANLRYIKLYNCRYTVIDSNDGENIELYNVNSSTILTQELGSALRNVKIENARNLFFAAGIENTTIKSNTGNSLNCAFLSFCRNNEFNRMQQIVFAYSVNSCKFRGELVTSLFKSEIYRNLVDVKNNIQITCKGHFNNNTIIGNEVFLISGFTNESDADVVNNNINLSQNFHVICNTSFSNNTINSDIFDNIRCDKFNNNIVLGNFKNVDFAEVINTTLIDSLNSESFYHYYENTFNIDKGIVNTNNSNDNQEILNLSLTYLIDTTSGSYSLQLPENPPTGTRITFIDSKNNCFSNPFTIKVNDSPASGVVNTINGQSQWIIDVNYGFLQLVYDSTSGWIVAIETTLKTSVDNITIEELPAQQVEEDVRTTGSDTTDWIRKSWFNVVNSWQVDNGTFNGDGFTGTDDGGYIYLNISSNNPEVWESGRYYFWTDKQIDDANGGMAYFFYDPNPSNIGDEIYYYATYDGTDNFNGTTYYRYYIELQDSDDRHIQQFFVYIGDNNTEEFHVYHYEHISQFLPPRHTIKNIDYIIDDDLESIDGSDTPASDPHKELVTRAYVDNILPNKQTDTYVVDNTILTTKEITLSNTPNTKMHIDVIMNGIILEEVLDYNINDSTITFTSQLELNLNDRIVVKYYS